MRFFARLTRLLAPHWGGRWFGGYRLSAGQGPRAYEVSVSLGPDAWRRLYADDSGPFLEL